LIALLALVALFVLVAGSHVSSATKATLGTSLSAYTPQEEQVFNGPFTVLSTTGTNLPCEFWTFNFAAATGQYLSGNFTSDSPVSFFIVPQANYQDWVKSGTCGNSGEALASQLIVTSYSFNGIAIPSTGTWTIVVVNSSNEKNADGYISAYLSTGGYTATQPFNQPLTGTITSTITSTTLLGQPTTIPGFPPASIILGIFGGLVAVVILKRRTRVDRSS
jgi:hypothetical protein